MNTVALLPSKNDLISHENNCYRQIRNPALWPKAKAKRKTAIQWLVSEIWCRSVLCFALLTLVYFVPLLQSIHANSQEIWCHLTIIHLWNSPHCWFFPSVVFNRHLLSEHSKPSTKTFPWNGFNSTSDFFRVMNMIPDNQHFWNSLVSPIRNWNMTSLSLFGSRDQCMINYLISAWSVTWPVHGSYVIIAWSATWSVHDSHVISAW